MIIEHVAFWVADLERMKVFYESYFGGKANDKYYNPMKQFQSYFISFETGCRLELMSRPDIADAHRDFYKQMMGIVHLAFSVGNREEVEALTNRLRKDGYQVVGEPRTTGDGYYESIVLDPENNIIEITA